MESDPLDIAKVNKIERYALPLPILSNSYP